MSGRHKQSCFANESTQEGTVHAISQMRGDKIQAEKCSTYAVPLQSATTATKASRLRLYDDEKTYKDVAADLAQELAKSSSQLKTVEVCLSDRREVLQGLRHGNQCLIRKYDTL